jgi:hypothetical protein
MMKKILNLFSFFGVFLLTSLLLTACNSDDKDDLTDDGRSESSAIVGEWASFDYGSNGKWMFMEMVNFKRNGTFTSVSYYVEGKNLDNSNAKINNIEKEKVSGTYTVSKGVITLTADGDTWEKQYSIKSDRLIIYDDEGNMYYDVVTDEIEEQFDQMEQWYQLLNNGTDNDDDPVWGGGDQGSNELVGEWIGMEVNSNGRSIYMEKVTFKNDGTYIVTSYIIHGRNLDTSGTIEQVDKQEENGKYRVSNGVLTLTSDGKTASVSYKVDETSLTLIKGEESISYNRMNDQWKQFVDVVEMAYQITHNS